MRWGVSALILFYLALLVLGPMTNPIGAPHLTNPIARSVSPIHQSLFMGHGYRFFGPDPGPSHSVIYKISCSDGSVVEGHFPDREKTSPRLLYHRWFMLSESLYREGASVPTAAQWSDLQSRYESQMDEFLLEGKFKLRSQLEQERKAELLLYEAALARRDLLIRSIAKTLLDRFEGESIEIAIQERSIPTPEEVTDRMKLSDSKLLTTFPIGNFTRQEILSSEPLGIIDSSQVNLPEKVDTETPEIIFDGAKE